MTFAILNQKGGVGKTTTVINLGTYLAKAGKKVLLIDIDPQANLTSGLGVDVPKETEAAGSITGKDSKARTIYDVLISGEQISNVTLETRQEKLDVLPSGIELSGSEVEMVSMLSRETILKHALEDVGQEYDYIMIDCPPSLGLLTVNALTAADEVLIPIQCEYFALEGLGQLMNTIKMVRANLNPGLTIGGVILTMFDARTNLSRDVAKEVKNYFEGKVFSTIIPRNIRLSEAPSHGQTIEEYDASSTGAKAYKELANELMNK